MTSEPTRDRAIRLVIFDLDGTLVEFHHEYIYGQAELILQHFEHPPVARESLASHFADFDFFAFVRDTDREAFIERFWSAFDWDNFPKPVPFSSAAPLLRMLADRGIRVAIATARLSSADELRQDLAPTGLLDYIHHIVTRGSEHVEWTDKTGHIAEICRVLGVDPAEAALVGDIPPDIASAKAAGVGLTVAVASGGLRREILEAAGADFLIPDIAELMEVLQPFLVARVEGESQG